jgi:hypothetical protein
MHANSCLSKVIATATLLGLFACKTSTNSELKTELGPIGNAKVVEQFKKYKNKAEHCDSSGVGTRVILTGFGLFSSPPRNAKNVAYNISGLISRFIATPAVFPSTINTATSTIANNLKNTSFAQYSHMPANSEGAVVTQRELIIDQKPVTVCLILLDVIWDQAAAIILYESTLFKPERIIMSGLNAGETKFGMFEAGAVNSATDYEGFQSSGAPNLDNIPKADANGDSPVLPRSDRGVEQTIAMTWNPKNLAALTSPLATAILRDNKKNVFDVRGEDAARPSNDYVCNNVSFVILNAMKGAVINLAGGLLRFGPSQEKPAQGSSIEFVEIPKDVGDGVKSAGFFHYPDTATDEGAVIFGWSKVLAKAMIAGL